MKYFIVLICASILLSVFDSPTASAKQLTIAEGNVTYFEQALTSSKCDEGACAAVTDFKNYIENLMKTGSQSEKLKLLQFLHMRIYRVKKNNRDAGAKTVITQAFLGLLPELSQYSISDQERIISSLSVWMSHDSSGCNSGTICPPAFMLKDKLDPNMDCNGLKSILDVYVKRGKDTDQYPKLKTKGDAPAVNFLSGRTAILDRMKTKECDAPKSDTPSNSGNNKGAEPTAVD